MRSRQAPLDIIPALTLQGLLTELGQPEPAAGVPEAIQGQSALSQNRR